MASIKKGHWRMQPFLDKKFNSIKLKKEEFKLWRQINNLVKSASPPAQSCIFFPNSKLIGSGWEWVVYELANKNQVVKIPAGIFPEVNDSEYLKNTKHAYQVCRQFIEPFVVKTTFERRKTKAGLVNMLFQKKLPGKQYRYIEPKKLSPKLRKSLKNFGQGMLKILEKHDWMPDVNLYKKFVKSKRVWSIWNLMLENEEPRIFDFTAYHDIYRLYPERTKKAIKKKGGAWQKFLIEIS